MGLREDAFQDLDRKEWKGPELGHSSFGKEIGFETPSSQMLSLDHITLSSSADLDQGVEIIAAEKILDFI